MYRILMLIIRSCPTFGTQTHLRHVLVPLWCGLYRESRSHSPYLFDYCFCFEKFSQDLGPFGFTSLCLTCLAHIVVRFHLTSHSSQGRTSTYCHIPLFPKATFITYCSPRQTQIRVGLLSTLRFRDHKSTYGRANNLSLAAGARLSATCSL